jgi:hypothetical protein
MLLPDSLFPTHESFGSLPVSLLDYFQQLCKILVVISDSRLIGEGWPDFNGKINLFAYP